MTAMIVEGAAGDDRRPGAFSQYLLGTSARPILAGGGNGGRPRSSSPPRWNDYLRASTPGPAWNCEGTPARRRQATPMSYVWKGKQYVVIAAGGHAKLNTSAATS